LTKSINTHYALSLDLELHLHIEDMCIYAALILYSGKITRFGWFSRPLILAPQ